MDNKENKICNGYESAYLFLSKENFLKHIEDCESCKAEHKKMQRVSELVQEAKPYIENKQKKNKMMKVACVLLAVFFIGFSFPLFLYSNSGNDIIANYSVSIEEMGIPVDEYGFIIVDQ